ncbi:MAG: hypothetical protein C4K48_08190 [Candidatus Thorarchaeota archaeon]|nr:MAG: hypothetical protein C4K48_08190 [Candidatus Thorarchaeota archaeon]
MIVAVSDIHLGDKASNRAGFIDFIERYLKPNSEKITELYLLGDILDFWRRDASTVISDNLEILNSICSLGFHIFYIVGNHDLIMGDVSSGHPGRETLAELTHYPNSMTICMSRHSSDGNRNFCFTHGHQFDYWYALPFYQAFCRAMCHADKTWKSAVKTWDLVVSFLKGESAIASTNASQLPIGTRSKIERRLAGPLEGNSMSKDESAVAELDLLRQFIDIGYLCSAASHTHYFEAARKEATKLARMRGSGLSDIESVRDLNRLVSNGTPEELLNHFLTVWSDVHRWAIGFREGGSIHTEQVLHRLRRITATLTSGLSPDEFLMSGHEHLGFVDRSNSVADSGCWLGKQGSFITINEGAVSLSRWPKV